jgi:hypothetical protein
VATDLLERVVDRAPPSLNLMVARGAGGFGVAQLHGGEAIAFLSPEQARAEAMRLLDLATLASRPGQLA